MKRGKARQRGRRYSNCKPLIRSISTVCENSHKSIRRRPRKASGKSPWRRWDRPGACCCYGHSNYSTVTTKTGRRPGTQTRACPPTGVNAGPREDPWAGQPRLTQPLPHTADIRLPKGCSGMVTASLFIVAAHGKQPRSQPPAAGCSLTVMWREGSDREIIENVQTGLCHWFLAQSS